MDRIKIVFGQDENGNLWKGHFGEADYFVKYDCLGDGFCEFAGKVKNTSKNEDEKHGDAKKLGGVKLLLAACDCAAACVMSPNFKKMAENTPIQPLVITGCADTECFLNKIRDNCAIIKENVIKRKKGGKGPVVQVL